MDYLSSLLREMSGLECQAMFECVESNFFFNRCLRQGRVEASQIVAEDGHAAVGQRVRKLDMEKSGHLTGLGKAKGPIRCGVLCGPTTSGSCSTPKIIWDRCCLLCLRKRRGGIWSQNWRVYDGRVLLILKKSVIFQLIPGRDVIDFLLEGF